MSSDEQPAKPTTAKDFKTTEKKEDKGYCFPISTSGRNERRCTVSKFKGKVRVDIREYYQDESGEMRPGKRGISLAADDWAKLASFMSLINDAVDELQGK